MCTTRGLAVGKLWQFELQRAPRPAPARAVGPGGPAGGAHNAAMDEFLLRPDPDDPRLTQAVGGIDQDGRPVETAVVHERPLTLFLNRQEIVTMMTIGDHPDYLAVGYLLNQNMLRAGRRDHRDRA